MCPRLIIFQFPSFNILAMWLGEHEYRYILFMFHVRSINIVTIWKTSDNRDNIYVL